MFMLLHGTHVYPKNSKVLIIVVKVKSCKLVAIDKWPCTDRKNKNNSIYYTSRIHFTSYEYI